MKSIIVNATALRADGALTILHQFLDAIPDDQFEYIIFVDDTVTNIKPKQNVRIIKKKNSFFL
jgi:hypothetical protein